MASQIEKVVMQAHLLHMKGFGPNLGQHLLGRIARAHEILGDFHILAWSGQRLAIHLAVGGERQLSKADVSRGDHKNRQVLFQKRAQIRERWRRPLLCLVISDQLLVARLVLARNHGAVPDRRVGAQNRFNFAKLDAVAPQLHLTVRASQAFDGSIGAPSRQIAGAVKSRARNERTGNKALRSQLFPVQITARQAVAADVQLPHIAGRNEISGRVQYVDLCIRDWMSDGDWPFAGCDSMDSRPNGGFRRSIHIPEFRATSEEFARQIGEDGFSATKNLQFGGTTPACVDQGTPRGRSGLHDRAC